MNYRIEERWCRRGENRIFGTVYIPEGEGPFPTVVVAHGYRGTYWDNENYARQLAPAGFAVYLFDFCGGSADSKSDGSSLDMSIITELHDLQAVLEHCVAWDFVDENNLFLIGESQGGFVTALAAAERPDIKGMVLLYPAFMIGETVQQDFGTLENVPKSFTVKGLPLSGRYLADLWDVKVYEVIPRYTGPVLIFHGTADTTVDPSYSRRAAEVYENARLEWVEGIGHGFCGPVAVEPGEKMVAFFLDILGKKPPV